MNLVSLSLALCLLGFLGLQGDIADTFIQVVLASKYAPLLLGWRIIPRKRHKTNSTESNINCTTMLVNR